LSPAAAIRIPVHPGRGWRREVRGRDPHPSWSSTLRLCRKTGNGT
jgi:hypothetical protein